MQNTDDCVITESSCKTLHRRIRGNRAVFDGIEQECVVMMPSVPGPIQRRSKLSSIRLNPPFGLLVILSSSLDSVTGGTILLVDFPSLGDLV